MTVTHYPVWNIFDDVVNRFERTAANNPAWLPPVDVREDDQQYTVQAELPGVDPQTVDITVEQNVLTIKGEKPAANEPGQTERQYGQFQRRFKLPTAVNAAAIAARSEHGVLTITVPKAEQAVARKIPIAA